MTVLDPWHPMTDPVDIKTLGKLTEELNECGAATARCLIQGIDESNPETGEPNRTWLENEIADVLANIELTMIRFKLDPVRIDQRITEKLVRLRAWHAGA